MKLILFLYVPASCELVACAPILNGVEPPPATLVCFSTVAVPSHFVKVLNELTVSSSTRAIPHLPALRAPSDVIIVKVFVPSLSAVESKQVLLNPVSPLPHPTVADKV